MPSNPAPSEPTRAEWAYRTLRDQLIVLDIAPGEPIREAQLMEQLGLGRTPVREALKRLEADHLVKTYPRRGTFATPVEIAELASASEVRRLLEPAAAAAAARAAPGDDELRTTLDLARSAVEGLAEDTPFHDVMAQDMAVHRLIYRAAGNHHLEESLVRLDNLVTRIWCTVAHRLPELTGHVREHTGLLEAVLSGEAERAARLSLEHINHFDEAIRRVI
ncbi:GntR family transcriptional regulator [Kocuria palustris]|uniref:GntR family transcriptional regulator n=1 Tax=Kocuria palustris TaxID=71999 RepID=UPI0011A7BEC9|nr:GntR family transcriptional regulator [Kocuria palustris]